MNLRPPPCESSWKTQISNVDWETFRSWVLSEFRPQSAARNKFNYAQKYAHCLFSGNLTELRLFSDDKRCHVMKALSALSKFLGVYEGFKGLVKNYGLKWGGKSSDDIIIARLTKPENSEEMFVWMKQVKSLAPDFESFVDFMAVTGLRFEEAVNAWNLIIELSKERRLREYYEDSKQVLEHFRFKEFFIRKSKKAFISFVAPHQIVPAWIVISIVSTVLSWFLPDKD